MTKEQLMTLILFFRCKCPNILFSLSSSITIVVTKKRLVKFPFDEESLFVEPKKDPSSSNRGL